MSTALSDLLHATTEEARLEAFALVQDNWMPEGIELFWKAIQSEPLAHLQRKYIRFLYQQRFVKVYPRLIRFVENNYLHKDSIERVAADFTQDLKKYHDDELTEEEKTDLDFALNVMSKSFARPESSIYHLFRLLINETVVAEFIPQILSENINYDALQRIAKAIVRFKHRKIAHAIYTHYLDSPKAVKVLLQEIYTAFQQENKEILDSTKSRSKRTLTNPENLFDYSSIPEPLKFVISVIRLVEDADVRSIAFSVLLEFSPLVFSQLLTQQEYISADSFTVFNHIFSENMYFSMMQEKNLTLPYLERSFLKLQYPSSLSLEQYQNQLQSFEIQLDCPPQLVELLQIIEQKMAFSSLWIAYEEGASLTAELDDLGIPLDTNQLELLNSLLKTLQPLDLSLFKLLERFRILTAVLEQEFVTPTTIRRGYIQVYLPASYRALPTLEYAKEQKKYFNMLFIHQLVYDELNRWNSLHCVKEIISLPQFWYNKTVIPYPELLLTLFKLLFPLINSTNSRELVFRIYSHIFHALDLYDSELKISMAQRLLDKQEFAPTTSHNDQSMSDIVVIKAKLLNIIGETEHPSLPPTLSLEAFQLVEDLYLDFSDNESFARFELILKENALLNSYLFRLLEKKIEEKSLRNEEAPKLWLNFWVRDQDPNVRGTARLLINKL